MSEHPNSDVINNIAVMDDYSHPWVEVFMQINDRGKTHRLTAEFFPHGRPKDPESLKPVKDNAENEPYVRLLQPEVANAEKRNKFRQFAAVVGRITYYEWK